MFVIKLQIQNDWRVPINNKKYNAGEPMVAIELFIVNSSTKMKFINQILFFNN